MMSRIQKLHVIKSKHLAPSRMVDNAHSDAIAERLCIKNLEDLDAAIQAGEIATADFDKFSRPAFADAEISPAVVTWQTTEPNYHPSFDFT